MVICVGAVCTVKPYVCMLCRCFGWKMTANISSSLKILDWYGMRIFGRVTRSHVMKGSRLEFVGEVGETCLSFVHITFPHQPK